MVDLTNELAAREMERPIAKRQTVVRHDVVVGQDQRVSRQRYPTQGGDATPHQSGLEERLERRPCAHGASRVRPSTSGPSINPTAPRCCTRGRGPVAVYRMRRGARTAESAAGLEPCAGSRAPGSPPN